MCCLFSGSTWPTRRGAFGVLLVRVLAAHNLINADWWSLSDPYTKAQVGPESWSSFMFLEELWAEQSG